MVGEVNRRVHEGTEIAIAMLSEPDYSVVLRTLWRVKGRNEGPGLGNNRRPDFQELLTDVQLAVWVRKGEHECNGQPLIDRIRASLDQRGLVARFGGLSLGESTHLVDEVSLLNQQGASGKLLVAEDDGDLSLPIWPDHVGSVTRWGQYRLKESNLTADLPEEAWTVIQRPALITR
jgi:CRISPR-associated protein Cas5t